MLVEALRRLDAPPEVLGLPMLVVSVLGLLVNLVAFALLRQGAKESLNVEGAYLEVVADALGSVGVIVAAVVIQLTGWTYVDPLMAVAIGVFILPRTWRLGRQSVRILIQAGPPDVDPAGVEADLGRLEGVIDVHDLHLWTLTSGMEVASAHLMVAVGTDSHRILDQARQLLEDGLRHRPRHPPGRARRPSRLRRDGVVRLCSIRPARSTRRPPLSEPPRTSAASAKATAPTAGRRLHGGSPTPRRLVGSVSGRTGKRWPMAHQGMFEDPVTPEPHQSEEGDVATPAIDGFHDEVTQAESVRQAGQAERDDDAIEIDADQPGRS